MSIPLTRIFSTQYTADPVSQTARPSFPTPYYDNYQQWTSTPYSYNHAGPPPPFNPEAVSTTTVSFPALPKHWSTEFPSVTPHFVRHLLELTFTILCMVAFGHTTLEHKWRVTCSSEEVFAKDKELVTNRLVTISVVVCPSNFSRPRAALYQPDADPRHTQASLLLASTAALVTTEPPETAILNYTIRGPYLCLWFSFGILLGGVIVASADVYVLATCSPAWARKVCPRSSR